MLRIQYHRYGGPDVMRLEDVAVPDPGRGQVRVRVRAAAANPADWKVRAGGLRLVSGRRFPRGLGHDFAGVVDAVGPGVTRVRAGDEVFGIQGIRSAGAFAEYLITPEKNASPKPAALSFEQAAALPMASVTAWSAVVDKAKVKPGQSVFITGCLGGVGRAAAQLALMRGAGVTGNCSAAGIAEARELGLSEALDYRTFDPARYPHRFDAVIDTAAALSVTQSNAMLKRGGNVVFVDFLPAKLAAILTSPRHHIAQGTPSPAHMNGIAGAAKQGKLAAKIARTVSLTEAVGALTELETKGTPKGKLVITPGSPGSLSGCVVVRDSSEGFLRIPCHVRVDGAVPAAEVGLDQAVAAGIEIVFRVVPVGPERSGEGVDERAVDPG
jgi:NADPH:quinone reductase-like Zn-dependent oxidoreductase